MKSMKLLLSDLIVYQSLTRDPVLSGIADVLEELNAPISPEKLPALRASLYRQVQRIMEAATNFGFTENLWSSYLSYLLATDENPLALVSEGCGILEGSASFFADRDFERILQLLNYDFFEAEKLLETDCFSVLKNYRAVRKHERMYFSHISELLNGLRRELSVAEEPPAIHHTLSRFYREHGVGIFGLNKAFRIRNRTDGSPELIPIHNLEQVHYEDLVGYERQKNQVYENTLAFIQGKPANNVLLYGDAGTGKSTTVKATLNKFHTQGLRLIEIYKHQFQDLSYVISAVKSRNYKFIIFMDDLSFEEFEIEYKYLKAVIEGGFETRPDNILIYATSNRRHLIKENLSDRKDMIDQEDIHHSDTVEEKLSLVDRFGLNILYTRPSFEDYHSIVLFLAEKHGISMEKEELIRRANAWSVRKGGYTGRIAQQFINSLSPEL